MDAFIYHWIDTLWLPVAWFSAPRKHAWWSVGLIACGMVMMRIQAEMMDYIGYRHGILGLMSSQAYTRGIVTYSAFYVLFFFFAHFTGRTMGYVFMGACITFFFMAFVVSMLVMVL
jgi:hypothetical protein